METGNSLHIPRKFEGFSIVMELESVLRRNRCAPICLLFSVGIFGSSVTRISRGGNEMSGRDPIPGPIGCSSTLRQHSRRPQPPSVLCRTTGTDRTILTQGCVARIESVGETVRSAPPQNRTPSRPGLCESMQEECVQQPNNH